MSRGPGAIERAIEATFLAHPDETFSTSDLGAACYPGLNQLGKSERVSILRAADKVGRRLWWQGRRQERRGGEIVWSNLMSLWSYAMGRIRTDFLYAALDRAALEHQLEKTLGSSMGAAWAKHIQIHQAQRDGDLERAEAIRMELKASVAVEMKAISTSLNA